MDYITLTHEWKSYIKEKLLPIILSQNVKLEGNLYSRHHSFEESDMMEDKIHNIYNLIKTTNPATILEIGFNAGFSSLLMKMCKSDTILTCVDLNMHKYVIPCYNRISSDYSNMELIPYSSYDIALPSLIEQKRVYDIIHIDGDHTYEGAKKDFDLCLKLSHPGTIIIFDDTNMVHLNELCSLYISRNYVKEYILEGFRNEKYYKHRLLEVITST